VAVLWAHLHGRSDTRHPLADAIVWQIRAPRVALGLLVGAALSGSGAVYQALFRNSLADPYIVGVSSGAALGAVLQMTLLAPIAVAWHGGGLLESLLLGILASRSTCAFVGGVSVGVLVYRIALRGGRADPITLLLAGVALSALLSSALLLLLVESAQDSMQSAFFWLMGGLQDRTWDDVRSAAGWIFGGLLVASCGAQRLNVAVLGDESARQLGISPEAVRRLMLSAVTLATAAAVAFSGIIGFVGLIVPHAVRIILGPDHRTLLPGSIIIGAGSLVVADALARTILSPREIPLGVITAIAGAPFFLYILRKQRPDHA